VWQEFILSQTLSAVDAPEGRLSPAGFESISGGALPEERTDGEWVAVVRSGGKRGRGSDDEGDDEEEVTNRREL
jgi:hypothetical protein